MTQNWIKDPIENLATFIANSATFQGLVGAADATAALNSIYFVEADANSQIPRCIVGVDGGNLTRSRSTNSGTWSTDVGAMWAWFDIPTPSEHQGSANVEEAAEYHFGILQSILDELEMLSSTLLNVIEYVVDIFPVPNSTEKNKGDDFWLSKIIFHVR